MEYVWPILILFVIALVFGILITILSKKLAVKKDEKEEKIRELLAGANCGACGQAGCDAFAKALCEGKANISDCNATAKDNKDKIADILGVENSGEETKVVVACMGGANAKDKYIYNGYDTCEYNAQVQGGIKMCSNACLGLGTCGSVCPEGAIVVDPEKGYADIDQSKCINCGACLSNCPKHVIKRIPKKAKVMVKCSNTAKGKAVMDVCANGCIGCGLCAKMCPEGAITMENNLPVIDYNKCVGCYKCVEKCPRHVIVKLVD